MLLIMTGVLVILLFGTIFSAICMKNQNNESVAEIEGSIRSSYDDSIKSEVTAAVSVAKHYYGQYKMKEASRFIHQYVLSDIEHKTLFYDSKTILQEMVQSHGTNTLSYHLLEEKGPDHCKEFVISCCLGDRQLGVGTGHSKKLAEQEAAYQAILALRNK